MRFSELLDRRFLENAVSEYLVALAVFLVAQAVLWGAKTLVLRRLKRWAEGTTNNLDDTLVAIIAQIGFPLLYFGAFYATFRSLSWRPSVIAAINVIAGAVVTYAAVRAVIRLAQFALLEVWAKRQPDPAAAARQIRGVLPILTVGVWGIGVVFLLDNLGFEISTVVAGLGITGIAVALGAQAVLGDLFAYVAIMFDRPFELDDFIAVGDSLGTVEAIGIKTTRLRSLSGEQLIFANKDMTDSRVRNYRRMQTRRIEFRFGVLYSTTGEQLREIPRIVRESLSEISATRFDRAHFKSFDDSSLLIEVVYFVLSPDYNVYMDVQQALNLALKERLENLGVGFAFPTRTIQIDAMPPVQIRPTNEQREVRKN